MVMNALAVLFGSCEGQVPGEEERTPLQEWSVVTNLWQQGQSWIPGILITCSSLIFVPYIFLDLQWAFPLGLAITLIITYLSFLQVSSSQAFPSKDNKQRPCPKR